MKIKTLLSLILIILHVHTQTQDIILPGLKGDSLLSELRHYYTPHNVLPYHQSRLKLFTEIFNINDSLECFYSGHKISLPRHWNPLVWTSRNGFQTEHLYPRSMGSASMPALGDLHHLVPVRATINMLRKNAPFKDIPDHLTQYWIKNQQLLRSIPSEAIHEYSESRSKAFEPRELVKGDIARSIFYFYTIYREEALKKNRHYFNSMLHDLCLWHRLDPVDSTEYKKTIAIARIQSIVNPFIIDPSLAERCYCSHISTSVPEKYTMSIHPNPSKGLFYIDIPAYKGQLILKISNQTGKLLETHHLMYSGLMT